jgi:hypothetical protein
MCGGTAARAIVSGVYVLQGEVRTGVMHHARTNFPSRFPLKDVDLVSDQDDHKSPPLPYTKSNLLAIV